MTFLNKAGGRPAALDRVLEVLGRHAELAIAVSGGMDSLVLAGIAHRHHPNATMFHAASPAVPSDAAARARRFADREGWRLEVIDAGELASPDYVRNPVDRCYHCKTQLYRTIRRHGGATIASGTNVSDLGDFRPGLTAAAECGVIHPYVEAGIDKEAIRALAGWYGWHELRDLPASPCLASRIETGIPVAADTLAAIDRIEALVRERLHGGTVRCRVRGSGVSIELDQAALAAVTPELDAEIRRAAAALAGAETVRFTAYRRGSAFLR